MFVRHGTVVPLVKIEDEQIKREADEKVKKDKTKKEKEEKVKE